MSVLGVQKLQQRISKAKLIEDLGERDLKNPEGVGRDLRLGVIYKLKKSSRPFIAADNGTVQGNRKGSEIIKVAEYKGSLGGKQKVAVIKSGEFRIVETIESINTPKDLMPYVFARSTLQRNGLFLKTTKTDPGYSGKLIFGIKNEGPVPVSLQLGARIANIVFFKVEGGSVSYRGQWQGGRVNTSKKEKQV